MTVQRTRERLQNATEFAQAVVELRVRLGRYTWEDLTAAVILAKLSVNPALGRFDNCVDLDLAEELIRSLLGTES